MTMIIALASPRVAASAEECLERIERSISEAATRGAEIVCFPEACLPGLRGRDFEVPPFDRASRNGRFVPSRGRGEGHRCSSTPIDGTLT